MMSDKGKAKRGRKKQPEFKSIPEALEAGLKQGEEKGKEVGYKDGYTKGMEEGLDTGTDKGKAIGRKEGYAKGKEDGLKQGNRDGFKAGCAHEYPIAYSLGRLEGKRDLVTTIEIVLAELDGYTDRSKWALEAKVPAWWIGILIRNWEPSGLQVKAEEDIAPPVLIDSEPEE